MLCVMLQNHISPGKERETILVHRKKKTACQTNTRIPFHNPSESSSMFPCWLLRHHVTMLSDQICLDRRPSSIYACDCFLWPCPFLGTPLLQLQWCNTPPHYLDSRVCVKMTCCLLLPWKRTTMYKRRIVCFFHLFCVLTTLPCSVWRGRPLIVVLLCNTMAVISPPRTAQHQENWANYHSEGASETNLTGPYKDSPRVA